MLLEKLQDAPVLKEEAILDRLKNIENALIRASTKRKLPNDSETIIDVVPIVSPQLTDVRELASPSNELPEPDKLGDSAGIGDDVLESTDGQHDEPQSDSSVPTPGPTLG
jgi:hypothetical protein